MARAGLISSKQQRRLQNERQQQRRKEDRLRQPAAEHRIQPGEKRNPNGRPKGSKNLLTDAAEVLNKKVDVIKGGSGKVTVRKAVLRKLAEKAMNGGDVRAAKELIDLAREIDDREEARRSAAEREAEDEQDRALIDAALKRLKPKSDDET